MLSGSQRFSRLSLRIWFLSFLVASSFADGASPVHAGRPSIGQTAIVALETGAAIQSRLRSKDSHPSTSTIKYQKIAQQQRVRVQSIKIPRTTTRRAPTRRSNRGTRSGGNSGNRFGIDKSRLKKRNTAKSKPKKKSVTKKVTKAKQNAVTKSKRKSKITKSNTVKKFIKPAERSTAKNRAPVPAKDTSKRITGNAAPKTGGTTPPAFTGGHTTGQSANVPKVKVGEKAPPVFTGGHTTGQSANVPKVKVGEKAPPVFGANQPGAAGPGAMPGQPGSGQIGGSGQGPVSIIINSDGGRTEQTTGSDGTTYTTTYSNKGDKVGTAVSRPGSSNTGGSSGSSSSGTNNNNNSGSKNNKDTKQASKDTNKNTGKDTSGKNTKDTSKDSNSGSESKDAKDTKTDTAKTEEKPDDKKTSSGGGCGKTASPGVDGCKEKEFLDSLEGQDSLLTWKRQEAERQQARKLKAIINREQTGQPSPNDDPDAEMTEETARTLNATGANRGGSGGRSRTDINCLTAHCDEDGSGGQNSLGATGGPSRAATQIQRRDWGIQGPEHE